MKKNEYSKVTLSSEAQDALRQLFNVLSAKHYSPRTIRNYTQEMRFIFTHSPRWIKSTDFHFTQEDYLTG